jgi:predicted phage terminase large subunit-like protein
MSILPLPEFVHALTPRFSAPLHLAPLTGSFESIARGEVVRDLHSTPPRHGKTICLEHGIAWLHVQRPDLRIAYLTYGSRVGDRKGRQIREREREAGVPIAADSRSKRDWATGVDDGGVWVSSVGGSITGEGFDVVVIDDLMKGRAAAESALIRDTTHSWLAVDVMSRLEPGGSVVGTMTRWHPDDPFGRLIAAGGWRYTNLAALALPGDALCREPGTPLWPGRWPLEALLKIRESLGGEAGYEWLSLYQGSPVGRGDQVFKDVHSYTAIPPLERVVIGIDWAYSTKTSADYSVAVVLGVAGGVYYVLNVVRVHVEPREFRGRVQLLLAEHPTATVCTYASAVERGGVEFFRDGGITIDGRTASADKFTRAIPAAAAWNSGKILVPANAPWVDALVSELASFAGTGRGHDDQVDALAAAFDGLSSAGYVETSEAEWRMAERAMAACQGSYGGWGGAF